MFAHCINIFIIRLEIHIEPLTAFYLYILLLKIRQNLLFDDDDLKVSDLSFFALPEQLKNNLLHTTCSMPSCTVPEILGNLHGGSGKGGKTMKAPGRDYRIFRSDFECDPADYFRNLRK
ncbi:CBL-interacting serine/threonine-protein kinase 7 [Spatholobus suberectus]|nr:CBL-interacting serine/threonine-protein kinase 7 [Spatholobus suberectus]